jgi:hypothetical protein
VRTSQELIAGADLVTDEKDYLYPLMAPMGASQLTKFVAVKQLSWVTLQKNITLSEFKFLFQWTCVF